MSRDHVARQEQLVESRKTQIIHPKKKDGRAVGAAPRREANTVKESSKENQKSDAEGIGIVGLFVFVVLWMMVVG